MKASKRLMSLFVAAVIGGWVVTGALEAHADFILTLETGATTASVTDNGAGDINPLAGAITFSGSLEGFIVNVTTGISKPILGAGDRVEMDLNSVNVRFAGSGTLTIGLTDTDFMLPIGESALESLIGGTLTGTTGSSLTAQQCIDFENAEFSCLDGADVIATNGPFGIGAFSSSVIVPFSSVGTPFSITERVVISLAGPGTVSFDFNSAAQVPAPGALVLLGTGLASLGSLELWRNRRKRRARQQ